MSFGQQYNDAAEMMIQEEEIHAWDLPHDGKPWGFGTLSIAFHCKLRFEASRSIHRHLLLFFRQPEQENLVFTLLPAILSALKHFTESTNTQRADVVPEYCF